MPLWNGVLPLYAYWKFDDFSWGETRKTEGQKTKKAGIEYEGEFDSSKITMKRWGEFERDRRARGSVGGDWSSGYAMDGAMAAQQQYGSPKKGGYVSAAETSGFMDDYDDVDDMAYMPGHGR